MSDQEELLSKNITIKKTRILNRRNSRMKIQFNLTKDQGEAFDQFKQAVNINQLSDEEFAKTAFMIGLQQMERAIIQKMKEEMEAQAQSEETQEPEIVEEETNETEETEE